MTKWINIYGENGRNPVKEEYWNEENKIYNTFIVAFKKKGVLNHGFAIFDGKDWNSIRGEKINSVLAWSVFNKYVEKEEESKAKKDKKKILYISGIPVSERSLEIVIKVLEDCGLKCICSYKLKTDEERGRKLIHSDYILMLPKWKDNYISLLEYRVAKKNNIPILDNSIHHLEPAHKMPKENKKPIVYISGECLHKEERKTIEEFIKSYGFDCCSYKCNDVIPWGIAEEEIGEMISNCDYILYLSKENDHSMIEKRVATKLEIPTMKIKIMM